MDALLPFFWVAVSAFVIWCAYDMGKSTEKIRWIKAQIAASHDPRLDERTQNAILFFDPEDFEVKK